MKNIKAFTLIEVIIVLGIISLIFGLTMAYLSNFRAGSTLKLSAEEIMATLNQARSLAITSKNTHKVVFDKMNNNYVVQDSLGANVDKVHKTGEGIIIDFINFDNNTVTFNSSGGANSGRIILKDNKNKYYTIKGLNVTGRIKLLNYQELPAG